jgi:hypothetical protein
VKVEDFTFGSIKIDGNLYTKDLWIIDGKIKKRDKSIAKSKFGTSHKVSRKELKKVVTPKTLRVIIGTGATGLVSLTKKASDYLEDKKIILELFKTGDLVDKKLEIGSQDSGIIHLTC